MQKISISFEDIYTRLKVEVTKITKVSKVKKSQSEKIFSRKYDRFVDLSIKPARATIWRKLENKFRNKRAKIFPFLWKTQQKTVVIKTENKLECPLGLNSAAKDILKDIKQIH